ncbi:hypothetical protein K435DRAFT_915218 [Dendrothele bispora CBS 962.96]|uniref:Uncharacterized protein n=1 Tax=Dendrothele bispora (strain CBS 962.96) TaxID=1314807 RepID=A0A4S8LJG0_DENBC|nr:hypothetical protein K435DRAFT_915218 [Dendrothele bispora CBS 962.96]
MANLPTENPNDILPPYDFKNASETFQQDEKKDNALQSYLKSPEVKTELQSAVNDLKDSAYSVEICFRNVKRGLSDAAQMTQEFSHDLEAFSQEWSTYHEQYIKLLCGSWRAMLALLQMVHFSDIPSLCVLPILSDFATDFIGTLKDDDVSLKEKKEEIKGYRERLKEDTQKASDLGQGFVDLQSNIVAFQGKIQEWMARNNIGKLTVEICNLFREIQTTQEVIGRLTKQIITGSLGALALGGFAAGLTAIGVICPLLWVGAAASAVYAFKGGMNVRQQLQLKKEHEKRLIQKRKDLQVMETTLQGLKKIQPILGPLKDDMNVIQERLTIFAKVWHFIHADLVEIEKKMELANSAKGKAMFIKRLNTVSDIYKLLNVALYQYETIVHKEDIYLRK